MGFLNKISFKKVAAIAMACFMVVGLVPTNASAAINDAATVAAGEVIATSGAVTFTASQNLTKQDKSSSPYVVGDASYSTSLKSDGKNNGKVDSSKARIFGVITATKNSKVTLTYNAGKASYVFASDTALDVKNDDSAPVTFAKDDAYVTLTTGAATATEFDVEAGKYYYVVGVGTNIEVADFSAVLLTAATEAGKTYSVDFSKIEAKTKLNGYASEDGVFVVSSADDKAYAHDAQHGAALYNGDKISFKVAGSAIISLNLCCYGNATAFKVVDASGEVVGQTAGKAESSSLDGNAATVSYIGEATTLTVVVEATGESYLHGISVQNLEAGKAEDFIFMFDDKAGEDGKVKVGEYKFGDSVLLLSGETVDKVATDFSVKDGKVITVNGKEYKCYTSGKRHADANFIYAYPGTLPDASKITGNNIDIDPNKYGKDGREVYGLGCLLGFTPAAKGMVTVYFTSTSFLRVHEYGADGQKIGETDAEVNVTSYSFEVIPGHKYVMSTTGKTNNCFYAGISYVADKKVEVATTITNVDATVGDALKLSVVDAQLGGDGTNLKLDATSIKLLNGHTYKIETNDGGVKVLINGQETFTVGEEAIAITLNNVPDVELTGKIVGTDASTITKMTFTGMTSGVTFEAVITGDSYKVILKPGEYNTAVVTTNGGFTKDRVSVKAGATNTNDVYVEVADPASYRELSYEDIGNLQKTGTVAVENGKPHVQGRAGDTLIVPVTGKGTLTISVYYLAELKINGTTYTITEDMQSYKTTSKTDDFTIEIEGDTTIEFVSTSYITKMIVAPDAAKVPFKSAINVPGDYATLNDAVKAINNMADRPAGEAGRVTITLTADIQEQVNMTAAYVTLKGEGHTISWYYGVGTKYYSVDPSTGLYNKRLAIDRYSSAEGNGSLWGGAFICRGDYFIAENTIFKNTYNYELTEAEKTDIAGTTLSASRLAEGANVADYKYKERSNAFYVEADHIELYKCQILSSQDTFGRNGSADNGYHVYLKDCVIGGNTDYICGEFSAVFDNCELQWKSFKNDASNNAKLGFIVAPKTNNYVFRNCTVTTDGVHGEDPVVGRFGRTWGSNSTATFINTETNGWIAEDGWAEMNTGEKASAIFNEYNNAKKGVAFVSTGATNTDKATVEKFIDTDTQKATETVLGNWTPVHYEYKANVSGLYPTPTPEPTPTPTLSKVEANITFEDYTSVPATMTKDGVVISYNNPEGKITIDANKQVFGTAEAYTEFTKRLKTGGKSGASNSISINAPGKGTLVIAARTGSSSATNRNLVITQNGKELYNEVLLDSNSTKITVNGEERTLYPLITVEVEEGTIELTYPNGGLYIYSVSLEYTPSSAPATGEASNVAIIVLLLAAATVLVVVSRRKKAEK